MVEIEILSKKENTLLDRDEIKFKVVHEQAATPTRDTVAAKLAAMQNVDRDQTILVEIRSQFGINESIGFANIYKDKAVAMKVEQTYLLKRNGLIKEETE